MMDLNKLLEFNKELNKNGYKLTNYGIRKETDQGYKFGTDDWRKYFKIDLNDTCIEYSNLIDEKIKEGVWEIDERKNPKKNLWSCYGFKHKLEKLNNGKYLTEGQMISIMVMKGLLRKWTKFSGCIVLLKNNKKVKVEEIWTNEFKPFLKTLNVDEYKGDGIDYDIFEWN